MDWGVENTVITFLSIQSKQIGVIQQRKEHMDQSLLR